MTNQPNPVIIQGGMGIAVSSWQLARSVARRGQLGVVSGTALDGVLARRLADGDPDGSLRRALAHFPSPAIAQRILDTYFIDGGRRPDQPYRPHPMLTVSPTRAAIELSLAGNFVEVWLAKEAHDGPVGINLLEKIQIATLSATLGAMLAGVDYVLMGAGIPKEIPRLLTEYAAGRPGRLTIEVADQTRPHVAVLDPRTYLGEDLPVLSRPKFLAIISLHVLGAYLNRDPEIRPDGFVVEGPLAGGHSAPPRGKVTLDAGGEPVYTERDLADLTKMRELGLPFWLAGAYGTPEKVAEALAAGAEGVQCGTVFALAEESGLTDDLRRSLLHQLRVGELTVKNDPLASPTGFPFKVAALPGTVAEARTYQSRERICDLGYLRTPVERPDGRLAYRCASEPVDQYVRKGGEREATDERRCLCNSLMANVGLGQVRKDGSQEPPGITLGQDLDGAVRLLQAYPQGWTGTQVVDWLLGAAR